tara:strand:+ start:1022 stop:1822 length:801 start_codon:yes stop_codon:yes gene_type:complete
MEKPTQGNSIEDLVKIVSMLRDPKGGCPWDLAQTHKSLIPYVIEEAYEVTDAIRNENVEELKGELGDLLLQVILHAQIASEENNFNLNDIIEAIKDKLIRRHPHVFKGQKVQSIKEVKEVWDSIKAQEDFNNDLPNPISSKLQKIIRSLSPINGAVKISKKVSKEGFEWDNMNELWSKFNEEVIELKEAIRKKDVINIEEEIGDIFFTLINIARWQNIEPEASIAGTNKRFLQRFSYIEEQMGSKMSLSSKKELKGVWQEAKEKLG